MHPLTRTQWLVLNSTADDFEDLERIYRSISLEQSFEGHDGSSPDFLCWRDAKGAPSLAEIADCIRSLVAQGLLTIRMPDTGAPPDSQSDLSYVWKGWFQMTPEARILVESSEFV
jgi:hypothetical protein